MWHDRGLCIRLHYRLLLPSPSPLAIHVGSWGGMDFTDSVVSLTSLQNKPELNILSRPLLGWMPSHCKAVLAWYRAAVLAAQSTWKLNASIGNTLSFRFVPPQGPINLRLRIYLNWTGDFLDVDRSWVELQSLNKHAGEASPWSRQHLQVWEGRERL